MIKRLPLKMFAGIALIGGVAGILCVAVVLWAGRSIGSQASRVYSVEKCPQRSVALVLGCAPTLKDGKENVYFRNRIACAAEIYDAGKADFILVSGDNSREDYDEPGAMKAALVQLGVPEERVFADYAGFSTLDSVVRSQKVFGQERILIVSQRDHAMRALYIAKSHGIDALGVAADDVGFRSGAKTKAREALARVRTVLDVRVLGRRPRFLGPKIVISGRSES
ncbi:MAG TPA: ElyC/SanA/YdcF family protein [Verrucomicrobiales bacterium]|nr:ElyC/SanA/YdcF family protein [Verrucomicrobiales bacterium]